MTDIDNDRRKLLKAGGASMVIGLAGCIGPFQDGSGVPGTVEKSENAGEGVDSGEGGGGGWLSDVPNYDGEVTDFSGEDTVDIRNGAIEEVEGPYNFEPPEIQIDPGTTVRWTWVGDTGHSVTHEPDGDSEPAFNSEVQSGDGTTFEYTFEQAGVYNYKCQPHQALGQKGRVRVGNAAQIGDWMSNVRNYDGSREDLTGQDSVTVRNGAIEEAEGPYNFEPPAITIDAGTTVTWEWVGDTGHSVTNKSGEDEEPLFNSEVQSGEGTTFKYTFEEPGVYLYKCKPHEALGQKGVVVVQ